MPLRNPLVSMRARKAANWVDNLLNLLFLPSLVVALAMAMLSKFLQQGVTAVVSEQLLFWARCSLIVAIATLLVMVALNVRSQRGRR